MAVPKKKKWQDPIIQRAHRDLRGRDPSESDPNPRTQLPKREEREGKGRSSSGGGGEVYGVDGGVPGAAGGAEGTGASALPPRAQGHTQLGRPPPPLLPGCQFPISPLSLPLDLDPDPPPSSRTDLTSFSSPAQASDLRDKFEANRHVVRPPLPDSYLHLDLPFCCHWE